jgi:biopolymer transport protein ExbB
MMEHKLARNVIAGLTLLSCGAGFSEETVKTVRTLTLMDMFWQGGSILWVTMVLGFLAVAMGVYFFLTMTTKREVPANFLKRALAQVRNGDLRGAYQMCEGRDELLANVIRAGLKMSGHDRYVIQDAMESEGERGATALWQKISWLNNIGVIAPLLGLLGTVWGMIEAFSRIAYDDAQVKTMTMAAGVSKAMVTTVGGLVVAIPCLLAYYYFRGRIIKIIAEVEAYSSELLELLTRGQDQ